MKSSRQRRSEIRALCVFLLSIFVALPARATDLDYFIAQYERIDSIHFRADVVISLGPDSAKSGVGSFEYWESNGRYRLICRTDEDLGLMPDVDVSFDGKQTQRWDLRMDALSLSTARVTQIPSALPNPLILPVYYLSDPAVDCGGCLTTLEDIRSRSKAFQAEASTEPGVFRVSAIAQSSFQVWADAFPAPSRIEQQTAGGKLLAGIDLGDYQHFEEADVRLPTSISLRVFGSDGSTSLRAEILINALEINQPIPHDVFQLIVPDSTTIWDADAREFVRARESRP